MVVKAYKEGKNIGKASKDITVITGTIGTVSGLNSKEVYGTSKNIRIIPLDEYKDVIDGVNNINWFSSWNSEFDPPKSSNDSTTVTFTRLMNPNLIWAEVTTKEPATLGETEQLSVNVIPPEFRLEYNTPKESIKVGEPVKISVKMPPEIKKELVDYRWIEPEVQTGLDTLEFTPESTDPVKVHVIMRAPHYGDELGVLEDELKPANYKVTAKVLKAKYAIPVQIWDPKDGIVDIKNAFAEGQEILLEAEVEGYPLEKTKYDWKAVNGCRIAAGPNSQVATVVADKAGICETKIVAKGDNNIYLGDALVSFDVTITQAKINKAKEKVKDTKAREKLEEAKKDYNSSKIDEAIKKLKKQQILIQKILKHKAF